MMNEYVNRRGGKYYVGEFGPAARWVAHVFEQGSGKIDLPKVCYYECDARDGAFRVIELYEDGRILLAYPGGLDGDYLPETDLAPKGEISPGVEIREITRSEFRALWSAFSRIEQ